MEILATFDRLLVQPTFHHLLETLREASHQLNQPCEVLPFTNDDWVGKLGQIQQQAEGIHLCQEQFPSRYGWLLLAWWTDRLKRRHFRIRGGHVTYKTSPRMITLVNYSILYYVYPQSVVLWRRDPGPYQEVALCRCGDCQPARNLNGWMGPCCCACYDREQDGMTVAPLGEIRDLGASQILAEHPDGRLLLRRPKGILQWDDGQRLDWSGDIRQAAFDPRGELLFLSHGRTLEIRDLKRDQTLQELYLGNSFCFGLSPDGCELAVVGEGTIRILSQQSAGFWNWTGERVGGRAFAWSPTGQAFAWLLADRLRIERPNGQEMVLHPQLEATLALRCATFATQATLAFTADGQTLRILLHGRHGCCLLCARWNGREWCYLPSEQQFPSSVRLSNSGRFAHVGHGVLFDVEKGVELGQIRFPNDPAADAFPANDFPRSFYEVPGPFVCQERMLAMWQGGSLRLVPWTVLMGIDLPGIAPPTY
ncbi:MAG: hypothetical protein SNJ75_02045 [Gemmataceae bacterium]